MLSSAVVCYQRGVTGYQTSDVYRRQSRQPIFIVELKRNTMVTAVVVLYQHRDWLIAAPVTKKKRHGRYGRRECL